MSTVTIQTYKPRRAEPNFWQKVGIPMRGQRLYDAIRVGLPYAVYDNLARVSGMDKKMLAEITTIGNAG